ncbi:putative bifunctional diguanylate cyclase/phosphodiesterase [Limobrevibacterium gyesilva]|uniref:EAL domain-containing protein n=1 Tax=Limobrevibacterium gyesilva TaxID=2991712 RepID=A0AA41YRV5_9PROT|nr:EAL domain-containing protein [Limobrevibacterium gyesilva]MCW3477193.1 EAL domain-containing protein [Limobrevibacterium gyesilva]
MRDLWRRRLGLSGRLYAAMSALLLTLALLAGGGLQVAAGTAAPAMALWVAGAALCLLSLAFLRGAPARLSHLSCAVASLRAGTAALERRGDALQAANRRFEAALNNMAQGLLMLDAQQRLLVCNRRLLELYHLRPEAMRPGATLHDMLRHSIEMGNHPGRSPDALMADLHAHVRPGHRGMWEHTMPDGRVLAARWQPMPGGGWIGTFEDITERQMSVARIAHMAGHDGLTGLPNRTAFHEAIGRALGRARRGEDFAVLCIGLDRFKQVNDTLGHPVGDALLRDAALRLRRSVREIDTVARFGGDEFAIVQAGLDQPGGAEALARRVGETLSQPFTIDGQVIVVSASVGIALATRDSHDVHLLLRNADLALWRAKQDGRGTFRFFEPEMDTRAQAHRALEMDVRQALARNEFELYYQPLVSIDSRRVNGFEALLRWRHPSRGLVPPDAFIPLAEEIGLIGPIGAWVLRTACMEAAGWAAPGGGAPPRVAVNLSPLQFAGHGLVETVQAALAASGLPGERLELEITESVLLQDNATTLETLHRLRRLGARICMDDFGTGYSSLSYLRSFPFDKIKIDKSFIQCLADSEENAAIVRAIAGLGVSLGIATTAEGVETLAQLEHVIAKGCTEVQGHFFSPPRPARDVPVLLAAALQREAA